MHMGENQEQPDFSGEEHHEFDLSAAAEPFRKADNVTVCINSPTLGDSVIGTAYLAAIQNGLEKINPTAHVRAIINKDQADLFKAPPVPNVEYVFAEPASDIIRVGEFEKLVPEGTKNPLIIDLTLNKLRPAHVHSLQSNQRTTTIVDSLYYTVQRGYPHEQFTPSKFADSIEHTFELPPNTIDVARAQMRLVLPENKEEIYQRLAERCGIDVTRPQIAAIVEASTEDKRYPYAKWMEVLNKLKTEHPEMGINVVLNSNNAEARRSFGPRTILGLSLGRRNTTIQPHIVSGNLEEMMVFLSQMNLVLSNDTGLAHVAAAVESGPKVVTLYKASEFPPSKWQSSERQVPVASEDGLLHSISPDAVVQEAEALL
jgi:ADP-heptose:LPS heptosyltransferase